MAVLDCPCYFAWCEAGQVPKGNTTVMGWESRARGGRYYTRSRKVNGRVVREYVGTGPVAELMAEMDALERTRRISEREVLRAERDKTVSVEASVGALCEAVDLMVRTALLLAGYRQHRRGEWRRRRASKEHG